jgi:hypothetical protein
MIPWIAVIILVVTGHLFWALALAFLAILME